MKSRTILLAVNKPWSQLLVSGEKTVEFRKMNVPSDIDYLIIYETKPLQKIIGYCEVAECIADEPHALWRDFEEQGKINGDDYWKYYDGHDYGKAYLISHAIKFKKPLGLVWVSRSQPPQCHYYVTPADTKQLITQNPCEPQ